MDIIDGKQMKDGWFVGDFEPTAYHTKDFEVAYKFHPKGEVWDNHYHKIATEINYVVRGELMITEQHLKEGDIFIMYPNDIAIPEFLTDCEVVVVKTPSVKGDKYIVE
jgi:quercetin dioxygenase-like cupin family protein